ncbi:MAG: choline/carnitine O-acyltransferase [Neisseria sp.]|uniref:choline/carnitine O-acyltransferase n=1 Tax=Neisseria sp. TaxID=192066 RepID=UPI0026DA98B5|nr:choline/carnitine O-acyltransferase [Neisseria sp.]MDO4641102.1 choline/carnitine O-acyltransferase [Neisseria sp.]
MSRPPRLPVPDLAETCRRYLQQVRPLLSEEEYKETVAATHYFQTHKGIELQEALRAFDKEAEDSWLIDGWLAGYLNIRKPLPLASNVGFAVQTQGKGLAEWAAALACVCADYYHQRITAPQTPQGTPVCMAQWAILQGAARIPQQDSDGYRFAPKGSRHIGIMHNGFYYRIAALDEHYEAYHPDTFRQAFEQIMSDTAQNPYPIAVPCYLGGNETARVYQELHRQEDNARLIEHIEQDLFHISLSHEDLTADEDLARATFQPQQSVWCYKPATFCYNTATNRFFLHCEHTWEDGSALKGIITRAAENLTGQAGQKIRPAILRYEWQLDAAQQKNWPIWRQKYAEQAARMRVGSIRVPFAGMCIPQGMSQDALMQFLLQYAQLSTYGNIRNTYEAVDVSHFQSGRTECVRPVSEQSLVFVGTLLQDKPDRSALEAALAEHKARVKAAKLGQGPNRHLLGLQLMAARICRRSPVFFKEHGYQIFTTDFLSTSTVGDDSAIINFAFAPTSCGGLGVNYTMGSDGWLFTVSHAVNQQQEAGVFLAALKQGGEQLLAFLNKEC